MMTTDLAAFPVLCPLLFVAATCWAYCHKVGLEISVEE